MNPEVTAELTYILLIELLSYQFCFPVKWIETQECILAEKQTERIIEVGPSHVLAGMFKNTLRTQYESFDMARNLRREILTVKSDSDRIYYRHDPPPEQTPASPVSEAPTQRRQIEQPPLQAAPSPPQSTGVRPLHTGSGTPVTDVPVSALDVIKSIIAVAMKKSLDEIAASSSVKQLAAGRSTLQNEVIGDLSKELGSLPQGAEDMPVQELGTAAQAMFQGRLGDKTRAMISRMITTKFSASFELQGMRDHLKSSWGIGAGRQDALLLMMVTAQPKDRLASQTEGEKFLDQAVTKYFSANGFAFPSAGRNSSADDAVSKAAQVAALTEFQNSKKKYHHQLLRLHAQETGYNLYDSSEQLEAQQILVQGLRSELNVWQTEHGEFYATGIQSMFSPLKTRYYDSSWNWAYQDVLKLFHELEAGHLGVEDIACEDIATRILNRADSRVFKIAEYWYRTMVNENRLSHTTIRFVKTFLKVIDLHIGTESLFYPNSGSRAPRTIVHPSGAVEYSELARQSRTEGYNEASKYRSSVLGGPTSERPQWSRAIKSSSWTLGDDIANGKLLASVYPENRRRPFTGRYHGGRRRSLPDGRKGSLPSGYPSGRRRSLRAITVGHVEARPRTLDSQPDHPILDRIDAAYPELNRRSQHLAVESHSNNTSFGVSTWEAGAWVRSQVSSVALSETLTGLTDNGISFAGKCALVIGAGFKSLGAKIIEGLLEGGAKVVVTTSSYNAENIERFQRLYKEHGGQGSCLVVSPFNQGSQKDTEALVSYIYNGRKTGLGWDLDYVVPFAAVSENGHSLGSLDSRSEFAHRVMLTNTLRLLGAVKNAKESRGVVSRPAQVMLPLSPNHGLLGNDGLYSESKLGLEAIFGKWHSEDWSDYLSICGAVIGWTRGTALMDISDIISEGIEKAGMRTFSSSEMASYILGLMAPTMVDICQLGPIKADLSGGMAKITDLKKKMGQIRDGITRLSEERRAIADEIRLDRQTIFGEDLNAEPAIVQVQSRGNLSPKFPALPDYKTLADPVGRSLQGMIDLDKVVVVTGFAEVGPWGNSRTRWEMEAHGQFSVDGCIEMAWMTKLIKHHSGLVNGRDYRGWVEYETGEPISDTQIKNKFEKQIMECAGIRLIASGTNFSKSRKEYLHEVWIKEDMDPFRGSTETALRLKKEHGDKVQVTPLPGSDDCEIRLMRGARVFLPKADNDTPRVAGALPHGWDPRVYGIEESIIAQVDPVTLLALVSTVETLLSAGITDPYEIYQYIHVSELGNCLGSGVGAMVASAQIATGRMFEREVQNDILQESFVNTTGAWVNMLLLSSSGAMRTPVGACATALESLDSGYELIVNGNAKICLVGGFEDMTDAVSDEFRSMQATVDVQDELAHGREPREMSRPAATSRNGFVESQGAGTQLIATASLALRMGLPIYGIVAMTTTASDKIGRSVPAPGQGLLTNAREKSTLYPSPMLSATLRRKRFDIKIAQLEACRDLDLDQTKDIFGAYHNWAGDHVAEIKREEELQRNLIRSNFERDVKCAQHGFGNEFWKDDDTISPIRGALATWGLGIDDLAVASFHGTSTKMSEKNESDVIHQQLEQLRRTPGNPVLGVFQKSLTGHPKGPAAAWMLNGCLQILGSGIVPGNRNLDNADEALRQFDHIAYPSETIQTKGVNAFSVTSFGFGQKGAQAIGVHPRYLFSAIPEDEYLRYCGRVRSREAKAYRHFHDAMINNTMFRAKKTTPYGARPQSNYLMDPAARSDQAA